MVGPCQSKPVPAWTPGLARSRPGLDRGAGGVRGGPRYAEDLGEALREGHRMARPGAGLAMTAFGRPENGDFAPLFELLADAVPDFAVEEEAGPPLEELVATAGFTVELADYRKSFETYGDMDTLVRGYLAIGPLRQAVRAIGEEKVAQFMRTAFAPHIRDDRSVRLTDEYRLVIARAG